MIKIVTLGGGEIDSQSTLRIDREIRLLTGKKNPRMLFIPTASSDSEDYWNRINQYYSKTLIYQTDVLHLLNKSPDRKKIRDKIFSADFIYVGGGNTLKMMRRWRFLGIDRLLKQALQKNKILGGISAGAICWHEYGHSDSMAYYHPEKWEYIRVKGMGLLKGTFCPHFDGATLGVPRRVSFQKLIQNTGGLGIGVEDNCAIIYRDHTYRVISSKPNANAYRIYRKKGKIISEIIEKRNSYTPIDKLYKI